MMKLLIVAIFVAAVSAACIDKRTDCKNIKSFCSDKRYDTYMKANCEKTCGFCVDSSCVDKNSACPAWINLCNDIRYKTFMRSDCQKTCKFCSGGTGPTNPPTQGPTNPPSGSCGNPSIQGGRVIAGDNAKKGAWPWQILLQYNGRGMCGGSIISPTWIVTAAHCVDGKTSSQFSVRVGEHDRNRNEGTEQNYPVKRVIKHPSWDRRQLNNDIAIIELSRPIQMNTYIKPVCLPSRQPPVGAQCYITGWGKIQHPGSMHTYLQQAKMPVVSNTVCYNKNKNYLPIRITDAMVCSGHGGSTRISGCHGDSGGPFVCNINGRWELHGAVSHGSPRCSSYETYTVYARVYHFKQWIMSYMR